MDWETKEIADKLCKEINETKDNIYSLRTSISNASKRKDGVSVGFRRTKKPFVIRLFNYNKEKAKQYDTTEGAHIIVFDGVRTYGTDLEVDEELISAIVSYYENKLKRLEKEFADLK